MAIVRTSDGFDVEWKWADIRTISLSRERLEALKSRSAIHRIMSHKDLYDFQINKLYTAPHSRKRAVRMRTIAKRISKHDLEEMCIGIGEVRICKIFYSSDDVAVLRQRLMNEPYNEERAKEDIAARAAALGEKK